MKTIAIIVILLVIVGAAGGWYWHAHSAPTFSFRTAELSRGEMVPTISATGTVEPQDVIDVGAQVVGQIVSFGNDANSKTIDYRSPVKEKMVLANIDPMIYLADQETARASLAQAKAGVQSAIATKAQTQAKFDQAKGDWDRAQTLLGTDAIAKTDAANYEAIYKTAVANLAVADAAIETAKATVIQDQAQLDKAEQNVAYCTIYSPVDGVIIDRRVNVGQTVVSSLNTPSLFLIAKDLTQIQVWVSVNEADVGQVYPGQPVTFNVGAYPGREFKGVVGKIRLNATMTQNVVTYTVEVNTKNGDGRLLPYMTANVQFEVSREKNALLVPNAALRWFPQPEMVAPDVRAAATNKKSTSRPDDSEVAGEAHPQPDAPDSTQPSSGSATLAPNGHGTVWVVDGTYVRPIKVRTGATDGIDTEISVKDEKLKEGSSIITGEQHNQTEQTTNPFAPQPIWGKKK